MKVLSSLLMSLTLLASVPAFAQPAQPDQSFALACHVALRFLNLYPTETTHTASGTSVTINFKSGAEGGEPNGIQCDFASADAEMPKLTHLITDTKRGYDAALNQTAAQDAIDQYFTELKTFASVMAEVTVSPAAEATAEPVADETAAPDDNSAEISPTADKLFWCTHALAQAAAIAKSYGGEQAVIDQYLADSQRLATKATQQLEDEDFDTSDLSELNADYEADTKAQLVDRTEEAQFTTSECRVLVQN